MILGGIGGAVIAALAGPGVASVPTWRPDANTIARIESKLVLPDGAHVLAHYERWYAGEVVNGRKVIEGRFLWSRRPFIRIVAPEKLPVNKDGGCDFVDLTYDVKDDKISAIACHGWG